MYSSKKHISGIAADLMMPIGTFFLGIGFLFENQECLRCGKILLAIGLCAWILYIDRYG